MANAASVIGKSTRIRGRVTGSVDLDVQGFVDGEIAVDGDVTVDTDGMVGAGVRGRRVVVRGAVRGDLLGHEAVVLEDGARVVGDVKAPRVAIATGALVRGFVETGDAGEASARASSAANHGQRAGRPAATAARVAPPASKPAVVAVAAKPATRLAPPSPASTASQTPAASGPRRPPPPIVPSLKKAKGQIAKKKER